MPDPGGAQPLNNTSERADPAPRSPKRRAKRGRAAKLRRKIAEAHDERLEARQDEHHQLADRIGDRLADLDVELRRVLLEKDHAAARRLARELGIRVNELARIAVARGGARGAAPDENPAATGTPYRGNRWRSTLGRGGTGAVAR